MTMDQISRRGHNEDFIPESKPHVKSSSCLDLFPLTPESTITPFHLISSFFLPQQRHSHEASNLLNPYLSTKKREAQLAYLPR